MSNNKVSIVSLVGEFGCVTIWESKMNFQTMCVCMYIRLCPLYCNHLHMTLNIIQNIILMAAQYSFPLISNIFHQSPVIGHLDHFQILVLL